MQLDMSNLRSRRPSAIALAAIAWGLIFLVKTWQLYRFGVDIPWSDQWDNEITLIYFKAMDGTLSWGDFWAQGNEHRIVLTKAMDLAIFELNGQRFRQLHVLVAQSLVFSLIPAVLLFALNREKIYPLASLLLVALFLPVIGWENFYWSYQSQVYFALLFGVIGTYLISHERPSTIALTMVTLLAGLSNASSFFIPFLAAIAVALWGPRNRRSTFAAMYFLALSMLCYKVFSAPKPEHDVFKATSLPQLVDSFGRYSAWPGYWGWLFWFALAGLSAVMWFKLLRYRGQEAGAPHNRLVRYGLLLGLWFGMFLASSIYVRAGFPDVPNRYFDYYLIGFAALIFLFTQLKGKRWLPLLAVCMVISVTTVAFKSFIQWSNYAQMKNAYRDNMIVALRLVQDNPQIGQSELEAQLKKVPLPYAGYPNYEYPGLVIRDPRFLRMHRHWDLKAD